MAKKEKEYCIMIDAKKISGINISRYADGYNYANISQRVSDSEYMSVHYEWKGDMIPEFALDAMELMKVIGKEKASMNDEQKEEYVNAMERASKYFSAQADKYSK